MLAKVERLVCRHEFYWSERRRRERCFKCGATRQAPSSSLTSARRSGSAVEGDSPRFTCLSDDVDEGALSTRPGAMRSELKLISQAAPERTVAPRVPKTRTPAGGVTGSDRRMTLLGRLLDLAGGADLERSETIEAVIALIDDANSSDPIIFGNRRDYVRRALTASLTAN